MLNFTSTTAPITSRLTLLLVCLIGVEAQAKCQLKADQKVYFPSAFYQSIVNLPKAKFEQRLATQAAKNQRYLPYSCLWQVLAKTDVDPKDSKRVIAFYSRRSIAIKNKDYGQDNPNSWNREHIWPKAKYFKRREQWAFSDAHHIRAADKSVNADRGSSDFAKLNKSNSQAHQECRGCRFNHKAWQPGLKQRGDTARMLFYMALRYRGDKQSKTPNLELIDRTSKNFRPQLGHLCDLLEWHRADPVSTMEKRRNNQVQSWQGNRNPFIDRPDFAERLFAQNCAN